MINDSWARVVTALAGRRHHHREVRRLCDAPWADPTAMDAHRVASLRRSVERAATLSPFYERLLSGRAPDISGLGDLSRIPVTSKVDINASGLDRAVPGSPLRPRATWRTSGSSGQPFVFDVDRCYGARHDAQRAFVYLHAGVPVASAVVEVLGFGDHLFTPPQRSYPTFRRTVVGYGRPDLAQDVLDATPVLLYGNRSHLMAMADVMESRDQRPSIPYVCSSSETLLPADRERLAGFFDATVLEVYGSAEASNLAFRLPSEEWTTLEPRVIVEVLDDDHRPVGPGDTGQIVVTTLTEPTSPLLRYATGDLATVSAGRGDGASGLRLGHLEGRLADGVVDAQGRPVGFWTIAYAAFWASASIVRHVRRWQVHQHVDRSMTVSLELTDDADVDEVEPAIRQHLRARLGGVAVTVVATDQVHDPQRGKFRAVTSDATGTAR